MLIESIVGSLFGGPQPKTPNEKMLHRIMMVIVIIFLIVLVIFSVRSPADESARTFCEKKPSPYESTSDCIAKWDKVAVALGSIREIDVASVSRCKAEFGTDMLAVWNCAKLTDGSPVSARYRTPGEGD
ncbi:hypothetical protein [Ochrobactrum sp. 3-3]|jgi:hypothetical protein|uniref:hypothetical protein n=1 Tax=Ochrobactrum sp. 3-3 TaxID=1830124 RepID=UPI000DEFC823|nr:hypothetical protein [Ochrobactrum sp. 3-3]